LQNQRPSPRADLFSVMSLPKCAAASLIASLDGVRAVSACGCLRHEILAACLRQYDVLQAMHDAQIKFLARRLNEPMLY
jgi:hypothetical protein